MTKPTAKYLKINGESKPVIHSDYEHTISGLLHKRVTHYHEAERLHDRLAEIKNDIAAMDRVLKTLGHEGDYDAMMPRQKRFVVFGRGELTRAVLNILRRNAKPMTSRQIAVEIVSDSGMDANDRKYITDLVRRVGKACRQYPEKGTIKKASDAHGNLVWSV